MIRQQSSIDKKLNLGELRAQFERIYPTAENIHMNTIADVMFRTNFKEVEKRFGIYYDFYQLKHINNACKSILRKSKQNN